MAISDFLGELGVNTGFASSGANFIQIILILLFAVGVTGGLTYWIINRKSYKITVHAWEDVNGVPAPKLTDLAREVVLPNTTTRAIQLKSNKLFLPRPSLQFGKNQYIYFIRSDGEWINVVPRSVNAQLKQMNLWHDHSDMRLANASLKRLVEKNYKKLNWLKEYAPYIGFAIIILMLGIAGYLVVGEAGKVAGGLASSGDSVGVAAESMENAATSFDQVATRLDGILAKLDEKGEI